MVWEGPITTLLNKGLTFLSERWETRLETDEKSLLVSISDNSGEVQRRDLPTGRNRICLPLGGARYQDLGEDRGELEHFIKIRLLTVDREIPGGWVMQEKEVIYRLTKAGFRRSDHIRKARKE